MERAMFINGTDAGETLDGTPDDDIITGFDGEDTINGLGGNDTIDFVLDRPTNIFASSVEPKRDVVDAGDGDDTVTGGRLDQLFGGAGNDTLLLNFNFNGPVARIDAITLVFDASGSGTASDGTFITGFERLLLNLSDTGNNVVDTGNVGLNHLGGGRRPADHRGR
ncbi:hypothetical protein AB5I41_10490 [Sphingomonas sp. MMS24-JH45]